MKILSIDPGNIESAYCVIDTETYKPLEFKKIPNERIEQNLLNEFNIDKVIIEMMASYRYGSWARSI